MSYSSRRPNVILPNNTMFVPTFNNLGSIPSVIGSASLSANVARYVPFSPPYDTAVQSISAWVVAGTTQNFDIGLYDEALTLLGSLGSTGIASTTGIKTWTPTTALAVSANRLYYAAIAANSTSVTWVSNANATSIRGMLSESSAFPLPSTAASPTLAPLNLSVAFLKIVFSG